MDRFLFNVAKILFIDANCNSPPLPGFRSPHSVQGGNMPSCKAWIMVCLKAILKLLFSIDSYSLSEPAVTRVTMWLRLAPWSCFGSDTKIPRGKCGLERKPRLWAMPGFRSWIYQLLALELWTSYRITLSLSFPYLNEEVMVPTYRLMWVFSGWKYVRGLEQWLAQSKSYKVPLPL